MRLSCFNPRTHTGCDCIVQVISKVISSFNPRTHTGCDILSVVILAGRISVFQSTHPHGVRLLRGR